ncbi:MAG: F0F1 ATP synthase subunit delta, partial [Patescibacteria group bacterium]|nr:F0F1 ATP synthase subunit delta [Patescibacteria group bacterium]
MKITAKQYAQSLYESIKNQDKQASKKTIAEFVKILLRNNDLKKIEKIIVKFKKIYNKEQGIVETEITCAFKLDDGVLSDLKKYIKNISNANIVNVGKNIDKDLIGGIIIKYDDKILD